VEEDFRNLFDEEPGKIVSVGLMTEADAGDRPLEAYYGDIAFRSRPSAPSVWPAPVLDEEVQSGCGDRSGSFLAVLLQPAVDHSDGLSSTSERMAFLRPRWSSPAGRRARCWARPVGRGRARRMTA